MSHQCVLVAACPQNRSGTASWTIGFELTSQAAGGSATIALGTGVIADISLPHERGKFVGIFQFAGTFSTASRLSLQVRYAQLTSSRSSTWRGVFVHSRMASNLLVPHHLLRGCSIAGSLVSDSGIAGAVD